ncbi:hypothetical protein CTA2_3621 [Colletotrichum tanaceti]|uniref:CCHC-type domain-containing protein n=1 Tax=Colletotrichum tanaceti TaxID=1306861 RepID=A0A4U6XR74_9PEZI|nr:hypothetical protein CTA2_3621 [Colletotrichum tanaceti]TKW58308.1 hypothetical protein CTA1_12136 [Colletotrichum tanaceti]
MAAGRSLPVPAQGDIYAHDGKLSITNAAANVFVVYGHQPQDASHLSSSLSVDFVMGNVYLIDSVYFPPFQCCSTRFFGSLIKGFGLDFDGCRRGDTKIKTVYDDVVCVVGNQPGSSCSIGTVASNLVTVSDLSRLLTRPKPSNVEVSYVHGMTLHESHLAYGGGLHRALSTWASMAFPPASQAPSQTSPTEAVTLVKERQAPKSNRNPTTWKEKKRGNPGQQNTVKGTINLKQAINNGDEAWQKAMDAKKQTAAAVREAELRNLGLLSPVQDLGPPTTFDGAQSLVNSPRNCGNCHRIAHQVRDCIGPVDACGFIAACPLCNQNDHIYDQCVSRTQRTKGDKKALDFEYLVMWRQNKAPIKSNICWVHAWVRYNCPRMSLPHTKEFALTLSRRQANTASYPHWQTYRYPITSADAKAESNKLLHDPGTIYEGGRRCSLCPGSQTINPNTSRNAAKKKMEQLGIKFIPVTQTQSKPSKKQKRNRVRRKMGGGNFATGANCTILQRPLPAAPPVRDIPSVKIKKEN